MTENLLRRLYGSLSDEPASTSGPFPDAHLTHADDVLPAAYEQCRKIARRTAGNFYYSFLVLPRTQRLAMCALYTFFRFTDDLGDEPAPLKDRRDALVAWRAMLDRALQGRMGAEGWWFALADTVRKFEIPGRLLHDVIDGVSADLDTTRYASFTELYHYCFRVASAVGLACIRIWGVQDPRAELPAEWCGLAFQLTNILRDIAEDFRRGRVYIPSDELARFGVTDSDLARGQINTQLEALIRFQAERAHDYYRRAATLSSFLPPAGRAVFRIMTDTYRGLLLRIQHRPAIVFERRVSLSAAQKALIVLRALPSRFLPGSPAL